MIIACIISFIIGAMLMLCAMGVVSNCKDKEPYSKVHLYVARDKDGTLWLYMGRPFRDGDAFKGVMCLHSNCFEDCNLNKNDYANLKWEDEPVEVFLNMEG